MTDPLVFDDVQVAADAPARLSFTVPAHQATGLVGDGHSGVDRLVSIALGLAAPVHGRVLIHGEDVSRMPRAAALAFRRKLGYVPAGDGLLQNLTLAENIALPLRFGSRFREHDIARRLDMLLAMVRLGRARDLRPAAATQDQRSRASLARALVFDPELVMMDHPFDGLSSRTAAELLEIARGGETGAGARRTVFITGQDLPDRLRPRIEVRRRIRKGELREDG